MMKKNTTWIIVVVAVLVVLGIILLSAPKTAQAPEMKPEGTEQETPEGVISEGVLTGAEVVVPDASPVSKEGEVLTPEGKPVDNMALPGSPEAPKQSRALEESELPAEAIRLSVSASGFTPNEFTVKAGEVVTLSITSTDMTHVFKFDDESLQGVAVGVAKNELRAIPFNAPSAGDYTFYCDVPGHRGRGETGVMHVE